MASVTIKQELPKEFLSDLMITAFDGTYGSAWQWFRPTRSEGDWLTVEHHNCPEAGDGSPTARTCEANDIWMEVHIVVNPEEPTGIDLIDMNPCIIVDHDALATGISRILNDDYVGVWRPAIEHEVDAIEDGSITREWRGTKQGGYEVFTHETARGLRDHIASVVSDAVNGTDNGHDLDADDADAIVQAAVFGKVIFS